MYLMNWSGRSRWIVALVAFALFAMVLAGCSGGGQGERATLGDVMETIEEGLQEAESVSIAAGGDVNFGDGVTPYLTRGGMGYPFEDVDEVFAGADLSFVNLECCISSAGAPVPGKEYCFRGPADSAQALAAGNVDVVSLANNHSKDYGTSAFLDTLTHLKESGVAWCGAGNNDAEAYAPTVLESPAGKVAFVAFTGIIPNGWPATASNPGCATITDPERVESAVKDAASKADYVVVSFHWGIELATSPDADQRELAHLAVDSGADLVLGHHPHVVQGLELYKNRLIAYSLGNYVFSPPREISAKTFTLVALLGPEGLVQAKVIPTVISGCRPVLLYGEEASGWAQVLAGYCEELGTPMRLAGGRVFIDGPASAAD